MNKRKLLLFFVLLMAAVSFFAVAASAEEEEGVRVPAEYEAFLESLPDSVTRLLPEKIFSDDPEDISEGIREISSPDKLLSLLFDGLLGEIKTVSDTLAAAIGIMMLSAALGIISSNLQKGNAVGFVSRLCLVSSVMLIVYDSISVVGEYFSDLMKMAAAYIPLSAVLYAIGGNVSTAVASSSAFGILLSACQFIFTYTAIPVFVFCASMAIVSSFDNSKTVKSISDAVKKYYTVLLSLTMTFLGVGISAQTVISAKADNASMRGARILLSNFVPISGGTISSSLGAIASGVELIRGCVGIGGIIIVCLMLLPVICHLLIMKLFFFLLDVFSSITGEENYALSQLSGLYSCLIGVALISSSVFLLSFGLLGFCASAIG